MDNQATCRHDKVFPQPNDVLCTRTKGATIHRGNRAFRRMVRECHVVYNLSDSNKEKNIIAKSIIAKVRALEPPGRFLVRSSGEGSDWVEANEKVTMNKVTRALREGGPEIREKANKQILERPTVTVALRPGQLRTEAEKVVSNIRPSFHEGKATSPVDATVDICVDTNTMGSPSPQYSLTVVPQHDVISISQGENKLFPQHFEDEKTDSTASSLKNQGDDESYSGSTDLFHESEKTTEIIPDTTNDITLELSSEEKIENSTDFFHQLERAVEKLPNWPTTMTPIASSRNRTEANEERAEPSHRAKRRILDRRSILDSAGSFAPLYSWAPPMPEKFQNIYEYTSPLSLVAFGYWAGYTPSGLYFSFITVLLHCVVTALTIFGPNTGAYRLRWAFITPMAHFLFDIELNVFYCSVLNMWPEHFGGAEDPGFVSWSIFFILFSSFVSSVFSYSTMQYNNLLTRKISLSKEKEDNSLGKND